MPQSPLLSSNMDNEAGIGAVDQRTSVSNSNSQSQDSPSDMFTSDRVVNLTTSHSPIDILPPELLAEIFDHCTAHDPLEAPVRLSHVSAFWRCTALTTPRLWRRISATIPTSTEATALKVRAWLARSGAIPLHISLVVTEWTDEIPDFAMFISLRKHGGHWGRFSLTAASYHIARRVLVFLTSLPNHGMLSRIDLNVGPLHLIDFFDDDPLQIPDEPDEARGDITTVFFAIHIISAYTPHLTELNLASAALPYASWGPTMGPELPNLRTLRIFERDGRFDDHVEASSVLHILAKCPSLEFFSFRGWYFFEPRSDPVETIHLPRLRELHVAQTFHQRIILSSLFTPALQVLRLSWLNRPDELIEESYTPDLSENGEEPTEFSQSPHTDILTGVGLRSLIKRSAPPIRMLDMDFADARSPKDFVWLFAQLPTLETFRIIGSDMSDKVLYALASQRESGGWLCPRLTSLEFSRCDIITGRGVIALARGRNPPPDTEDGTAEERSQPARLTTFNVEACTAVDCESVAVKQYLIGDVDFEVEVIHSSHIFPEDGIQMPE